MIRVPKTCWYCHHDTMRSYMFKRRRDDQGGTHGPMFGGLCSACGATCVPQSSVPTLCEITERIVALFATRPGNQTRDYGFGVPVEPWLP